MRNPLLFFVQAHEKRRKTSDVLTQITKYYIILDIKHNTSYEYNGK